ncbi:MAG TPA: tetratricopeptide repeat protein [Bdellovibrionota bacterium]|nr:tetratricopeptide repeat protein [Bdellovibrionota bacterium]
MKRNPGFLSFGLTLVLLGACSGGKVHDFNTQLDGRIQKELDKRQGLVKGNPAYLSLVSELSAGRELLQSGKAKEAFLTFDKILQEARYSNYPEYSYAKYYLAASLYEMGVDYGALLYFADIVQKEPLKTQTHESLRRAISIARRLKDDELVLYLASSITPDKVPLSLREEFRFYIGKDLYKKQNYPKAIELFTGISHRNQMYLAAQYLLGTVAVQEKDFKRAITHFRNISDARSPVTYYEDLKIRQLANLALGRILYEQQNYPLSIVYYKKVKKDGDFYPESLYESSWALFKLNKFNEALSVLHTLNSPYFEQVYFLKSMLLKGAIYIELCWYERAVDELSTVESKFGGLRGQIDRFAQQARSPQEYYPLLSSKIVSEDGSEDYAYKEIFNLAAANRDFLAVHRYIGRLTQERKTLAETKSPRANLLAKLIQQKESDLILQASWMAGKKMLLTRRLILDFNNAKDIVRYEIISAERKILQSRARGLAPAVISGQDLIKPEFTESLKETLIWWDYTGEYWEDELGAYLYDLKNRCKKAEKTQ